MANICDNTFYAFTEDPKNTEVIVKFFEDWDAYSIEVNEPDIDISFESKWDFPEEKMKELYEAIPNKEDIYMRCLSVEYGCMYHALWQCNKDGWEEV